MYWKSALALLATLAFAAPCRAQSHGLADAPGPRLALVIGQQGYAHQAALRNSHADGRAFAQRLEREGFELVGGGPALDLTGAGLRDATAALVHAVRVNPGAPVVFLYSGHGLQWESENYLLGIDAPLSGEQPSQENLSAFALDLRTMLGRVVAAGSGPVVVLLNACRDNPWSPPHQQGLGAFPAPDNVLIAYASAPGTVSYDQYRGSRRSPFVGALLAELDADPTRPLSSLLPAVRERVSRQTVGGQTPWERSSLFAPFFIGAPRSAEPPAQEALSEREQEEEQPASPRRGTPLSLRRNMVDPLIRIGVGGHVIPRSPENAESFVGSLELGARIMLDPLTGFSVTPGVAFYGAAGDAPTAAAELGVDLTFEISAFFVGYTVRGLVGTLNDRGFAGFRHGLRFELAAMGVLVTHDMFATEAQAIEHGISVTATFDFGALLWD